ncbi:MAG: HAD hydrolase-like protein [Clostridia bacterium]|nr:HAD hydrolase-like protein [Clostridia bacterium]
MKKVLITDLDDTLYPWIDVFVPSFYAMASALSSYIKTDLSLLFDEYRAVHQYYGNVEHPYATLALPSVSRFFGDMPKEEQKNALSPVFDAYRAERQKRLHLFPRVKETLSRLHESGVTIIGYTNSTVKNGYGRLKSLDIAHLFSRVYCAANVADEAALPTAVRTVTSRKPDKDTLLFIIKEEGFSPDEAICVGDSMTNDVYMAWQAGVTSVLLPHPPHDAALYDLLVEISSWTDATFALDRALKEEVKEKGVSPDYTFPLFSDLLPLFSIV